MNQSGNPSEGAGVGFGAEDYQIPQAERGRGRNRVYHFFNSALYPRQEVVEIMAWDWNGIKTAFSLLTQRVFILSRLLSDKDSSYWGHQYLRLYCL